LDTSASNSTGPLHFLLSYPGTYTFRIKAIINKTPCNIEPGQTDEISITVNVAENGKTSNSGPTECQTNVGDPINVTNGNMYLTQTDYRLPGIGDGLDITRTYNSNKQANGLFGVGWSSILDESVMAYGNLLVRLNLPDGRAVYFTRKSGGAPFDPLPEVGFYGQVVKNVDNSYTLTFRDGSVHQFNANGKLTSFADPNGNTITLTLNASGSPTTITDASGRTVTLTYDTQSKIATISDNLGTIATYTRLSSGRLSSVTYADGSKYQFTYLTSGNNFYLTTVKDALNNVLESHTYVRESKRYQPLHSHLRQCHRNRCD
jgi:YD repeat-containing protein